MIPWPVAFHDYARTEIDAFATTFNLESKLLQASKGPISAHQANRAASSFIEFVNVEKSKVQVSALIGEDPLWSINREQDAHEAMNYFMNMLIHMDNPVAI